VHMTKRKD